MFFSVDSEEEGSEDGEVLGVHSRPEASPELILSSSMCNECVFFCVDSDEVCVYRGIEMWLAESWERGSVEQDMDFSVRNQCFQIGVQHLSNVSAEEERDQSKTAAGSWEEWSGWKTCDTSRSEGVWNKKWKGARRGKWSSSGRKEVKASLM